MQEEEEDELDDRCTNSLIMNIVMYIMYLL